jgi:RNA polymerase sigma factor (TIGR02999 family)
MPHFIQGPHHEMMRAHGQWFGICKNTQLLIEWNNGRNGALEDLLPLVYGALRRLAAQRLRRERPDHTLQPTALVHEAYLRLVDQRQVRWQNRAHFYGVAAHVMGRILVDRARARNADKRGAGWERVTLVGDRTPSESRDVDVLALDDALKRLATLDPQQERIVELRYFGGLTLDETAEVMGISTATVKREWVIAKAWLRAELSKELD